MLDFSFLPLNVALLTTTPVKLPPYKGATFRGAFGATFRQVVCVLKGKRCSDCILKEKCAYSYIFETPVPSNASKMRKYPYAPHPFVLVPPLEDRGEYEPGELLQVSLTLIGRGVEYLPYFLYTFQEMGRRGIGKGRGKFQIQYVKDLAGKAVYEDGLLHSPQPLSWRDLQQDERAPGEVTLRFLTPLRVKYRERLCSDLEFHILMRALLRRISLLSTFHCGRELQVDFRRLIQDAQTVGRRNSTLRWHDWMRYSHRQRAKLKMGGLIGEVTFEGDLEPFWPFLQLGQWIHVGKGTSFGLGKYEIVSRSGA